jgi:hypothetical protein
VIEHDRLAEVFDRGLRDGIDALPPSDRDLFRFQDFIIEWRCCVSAGHHLDR